jgi:hypothetical protein
MISTSLSLPLAADDGVTDDSRGGRVGGVELPAEAAVSAAAAEVRDEPHGDSEGTAAAALSLQRGARMSNAELGSDAAMHGEAGMAEAVDGDSSKAAPQPLLSPQVALALQRPTSAARDASESLSSTMTAAHAAAPCPLHLLHRELALRW